MRGSKGDEGDAGRAAANDGVHHVDTENEEFFIHGFSQILADKERRVSV
jgi:hypothetical protein